MVANPDDDITNKIEGLKLYYDTFKHLTTLNTGSILILATFLEKLFSNPEWKILISITFAALILSMMSAVVMMLAYSNFIRWGNRTSDKFEDYAVIAAIICISGFILGIISFSIFSLKNFY